MSDETPHVARRALVPRAGLEAWLALAERFHMPQVYAGPPSPEAQRVVDALHSLSERWRERFLGLQPWPRPPKPVSVDDMLTAARQAIEDAEAVYVASGDGVEGWGTTPEEAEAAWRSAKAEERSER